LRRRRVAEVADECGGHHERAVRRQEPIALRGVKATGFVQRLQGLLRGLHARHGLQPVRRLPAVASGTEISDRLFRLGSVRLTGSLGVPAGQGAADLRVRQPPVIAEPLGHLIGLGREFAEPSGVPRRDECGGRKTIESFTSDAGVFYAYGASPSWDGYEFHVADSSFAGAFPTHGGQARVWLSRPRRLAGHFGRPALLIPFANVGHSENMWQ
jgi:hypothetical protein